MPSARATSATFTVSIGVPPPMVTIRSGEVPRMAEARARTLSLGTWATVSSKRPTALSPRFEPMRSTSSVFRLSVLLATRKTRDAARRSVSSLTASAAGFPKITRSCARKRYSPTMPMDASLFIQAFDDYGQLLGQGQDGYGGSRPPTFFHSGTVHSPRPRVTPIR